MSVVAAGFLSLAPGRVMAADALTFPQGPVSNATGIILGGTGWSFVPTTDILVTSVGYLINQDGGNPDAVVTIWAGTNTVIASYTGLTNPAATFPSLLSKPVPPLPLSAGQTYSIMVYIAPLTNAGLYISVLDNTGVFTSSTFNVASNLSQYAALQISQEGVISAPDNNQTILYLGPTFTYSLGVLVRPELRISLPDPANVRLSWTTNSPGFALQQSPAVTGTYVALSNAPVVIGPDFTVTLPNTNAGFFRLAKPN